MNRPYDYETDPEALRKQRLAETVSETLDPIRDVLAALAGRIDQLEAESRPTTRGRWNGA